MKKIDPRMENCSRTQANYTLVPIEITFEQKEGRGETMDVPLYTERFHEVSRWPRSGTSPAGSSNF